MIVLPLKDIETAIKARTQNLSEVHGFGHLKRTAIGAQFFAKVFKTPIQEQEIAYTAGLIHDLERPNTEKIDHADISVREAREFLTNFSINQEIKDEILLLIQTHRHPQDIPLNQQWVYLSDKLLEQSGAYVIFRRSYYVGECEDFTDISLEDALKSHMNARMEKFRPDVFHKKVRNLASYQYQWQVEFINSFLNKEKWATRLARQFGEYGRKKMPELGKLIKTFEPITHQDQKIKEETLSYITGNKYSFFEKLLPDK